MRQIVLTAIALTAVVVGVLAICASAQFKESPGAAMDRVMRESARDFKNVPSTVPKDAADPQLPTVRRSCHGVEVLTAVEGGVNICGYLDSVMEIVRRNWYREVPSSARASERRTWRKPKLKRGIVKLEFLIARDGGLHDIHVVDGSGDDELDAAAVAGLQSSDPLPVLPRSFKADSLLLRFSFYYNPSRGVRRY